MVIVWIISENVKFTNINWCIEWCKDNCIKFNVKNYIMSYTRSVDFTLPNSRSNITLEKLQCFCGISSITFLSDGREYAPNLKCQIWLLQGLFLDIFCVWLWNENKYTVFFWKVDEFWSFSAANPLNNDNT